jgi:DNA polymerase III subunit alpha
MSEFVHLHLHTQFSLLDGAIRFDRLFKTAKGFGMNACSITDHGNMFGVVDFHFTAKEYGIKPILGCETYIAPKTRFDKERGGAYHMILLAMNNEGYGNLIKLVSAAHLEGFYYVPRIDKDLLREHNAGLICLTACLKGQIPQAILRDDEKGLKEIVEEYLAIFDDRLYLEIQNNGIPEQKKVNDGLIQLARHYSLPLVATNDCHYLKREESRAHELLLCIQTGKTIHDADRMVFSTDEFYFKSTEEMASAFANYPEALENTLKIAEMCNVEVESGKYHFPEFRLPEGESLDDHFDVLCRKGFEQKMQHVAATYPDFPDELRDKYRARLDYEIDVVKRTGFSGYFLIVSDFIGFAKGHDIPVGPGRGSAAGSLAAYSLDITAIDPIKYDLLFERFLNPERVSMPDIDVDFCIRGRGDVIDYVTEKYGKENVAQIITFGTMKSKAAVRDVGRALGLPYAEVDKIAKLIPNTLDITIEQAMADEPQLRELYETDPRIKELLDNAMVLERLARHASTHAAGIVISNKPLVEYLPLCHGSKGETITQYPMKTIEKIGLIKFDLLGLKTLTVLDDVLKMLRAKGVNLDLNNLPLGDRDTFELLSSGDTFGVFQLESRGMRELLVRLKPSQFEDIIALIALYRPGPLGSGMMEEFIRRKNNPALVRYETPLLEEVLKDTYGVIVYQEQIMKIASRLGNFSQGEADALRKAISKKVPEQLESYRGQFVEGCQANDVRPEAAVHIYDVILNFGQYGFNKSHSAAYALVAFQTAFLKSHYRTPFMAAILTNEVNDTDSLIKYIADCREKGIEILPPDINESDRVFTVVGDSIRFGLAGIKGLGVAAIDIILSVRAECGGFPSFTHFCSVVDSRKVNKKVVESLVKAGCFDNSGLRRGYLLALVRDKWDKISKRSTTAGQQLDMFGSTDLASPDETELSGGEELPYEEVLRGEKEALGFYFSEHPLKAFEQYIRVLTPFDTAAIKEMDTNGDVKIVALVNSYKEIVTKRGDRMANITLEDTRGIVDAIVFPDLLAKQILVIKSEKPLVITGSVEKSEEGSTKIRVKGVTLLEDEIAEMRRTVRIKVDCSFFRKEDLRKLKDVFFSIRGESKVVLELRMNGQKQTIDLQDTRVEVGKLDALAKYFENGIDYEVIG